MPLALLSALLCLAAPAQPPSGLSAAATKQLLDGVQWRSIGPAVMGGRIDDVAVSPANPAIVYVAAAGGGVWKSINHGTTFTPVFDQEETLCIGDIAIAPSDPEIVWVGTGESNNRQSSSWGAGVYLSTNGGKTWRSVGLRDTMHIGRIAVDPRSAATAYVAAGGRLWGANEERGLFKTTDSGATWSKVLYADTTTGCTDVLVDPSNPDVVYACMYQRQRAPWGYSGGGPGSGIFKSTDAGATWSRLSNGLPTGDLGRIGLDIYPKNTRILYACVDHPTGVGIYRSSDAGLTWVKTSDENPRPWYFSQIRVDPNNDQVVWVGGVSLSYSTDGGKSFRTDSRADLHADIHAIWLDPANSNHMLVGCDGGIQWSHDGGHNWDYYNTIPVSQFYAVDADMSRPYRVTGGLQDNGSWVAPSFRPDAAGTLNTDWTNINQGDGFHCAFDKFDNDIVYSESQNGAASRMRLSTGERKMVQPRSLPGEPPLRFDWNTPIVTGNHKAGRLYIGGNRLWISDNFGDTWRRTDDLSTNPDRTKLPVMGRMPVNKTYPFADYGGDYGQVVTVAESPIERGFLCVGTDDGNLQLSRDDGKSWTNVVTAVTGVPRGTYVSRVSISANAKGRVYASFDGHRTNDFHPYALVSDDYGATWRSISSNLPEGACVNCVIDHPRSPRLLFAGTERGAWVSFDQGGSWTQMGGQFPHVRVDFMMIHPRDNDLIVATHGRGIYVADDIGPLECMARDGAPTAFSLFAPRPAVCWRTSMRMSTTGNRTFAGANPNLAGAIQFFVTKEPAADVIARLHVTTKDGKPVRSLTVMNTDPGLRRVVWDLRYGPYRKPGAQPAPAAGGGRRTRGTSSVPPRGVWVEPGEYNLTLEMGAQTQTATIRVEEDPRSRISPSDRKAWSALTAHLAEASETVRSAEQGVRAALPALRDAIDQGKTKPWPGAIAGEMAKLVAAATEIQKAMGIAPAATTPGPAPTTPAPAPAARPAQVALSASLSSLYQSVSAITELPSAELRASARSLLSRASGVGRSWSGIQERMDRLNADLKAAKLKPLQVAPDDASF